MIPQNIRITQALPAVRTPFDYRKRRHDLLCSYDTAVPFR